MKRATAPIIESARVRLRPWCDADHEPWLAMCADARMFAYFPRVPTPVEALASAVAFRERLVRDGFGWWVLEIRATGAFGGTIALQDVPFAAHFTPALEIGWRVAHAHWGRGYATEGARAALDHAFDVLEREQVVAMTARLNVPSRNVMHRLAMRHDPADDFDNPRIAAGDPLRPHVLFRANRDERVHG